MFFARAAAVVLLLAAAACTSSANGDGHRSATTASASVPATLPVPTPANTAGATPQVSSDESAPAPSGPTSGGSGSAPVTGTPTPSAPTQPLRTVTAHSAHGDFVIEVWVDVASSTCADHAHGSEVIKYLRAHPCTGLDRVLATTTVDGRSVGFAAASLGFAGKAPASDKLATAFAALLRRNRPDNLTDLLHEGHRLPSGPTALPGTDAFAALAQGSDVSALDAWYLDGPTTNDDPALVAMAEDVYGQF